MDKPTTPSQTAPPVVFAATDLSTRADEALRQADARARSENARLVVCHVIPNLSRVNMLFPERHAQEFALRAELQRQVLQALIERTCKVTGREPSEFEPLVDDGAPYATIVERAEQVGASLIVVGDHGDSGLTSVLLGSVADRVIRYAHCPVLVARTGAPTGRILVATDLSDPSLPALTAAAREAAQRGARVTAIHCIELVGVVPGPEYSVVWPSKAIVEVLNETRARAGQQLADALRRFELEGELSVVEGSPTATILLAAEEHQAELVIVGTRGKTGLRRVLLGSVAEAVVRRAPCSVLVVRLADDGPDATPSSRADE